MPDKLNLVEPASLKANGLKPIFLSWKQYTIKCGACGSMYPDKVLFLSNYHDARSRCPMCDAINYWSHVEFLEWYAMEFKREEANRIGWQEEFRRQLRHAILNALGNGPMTTSSLRKALDAFDKKWAASDVGLRYAPELCDALAKLESEDKIRKHLLFWWRLAKKVPDEYR